VNYVDSRAEPVCDMYARLKPFRCQHPAAGKTLCQFHVTRGVPAQFQLVKPTRTVTVDQQQHADPVSREQLIAAFKLASQSKVRIYLIPMQRDLVTVTNA